ncbi:hypothetical protein Unana1_06643 [Umbelopsis nana]
MNNDLESEVIASEPLATSPVDKFTTLDKENYMEKDDVELNRLNKKPMYVRAKASVYSWIYSFLELLPVDIIYLLLFLRFCWRHKILTMVLCVAGAALYGHFEVKKIQTENRVIQNDSILHIKWKEVTTSEAGQNSGLGVLEVLKFIPGSGIKPSTGQLNAKQVAETIYKAANDPRIIGITCDFSTSTDDGLNLGPVSFKTGLNMAVLQEVRHALLVCNQKNTLSEGTQTCNTQNWKHNLAIHLKKASKPGVIFGDEALALGMINGLRKAQKPSVAKLTRALIPTIRIAELQISGGIVSNDNLDTLVQNLDCLANDASIQSIILRVDSSGGSYLASDTLSEAIQYAKSKKPVVASIGGMAASGAYYVVANASKVIANRASLIGSIGVTSMVLDFSSFLSRFVITYESLYVGVPATIFESKTEEQLATQEARVQYLYQKFVERVSNYRNISQEIVDEYLAQGRLFTGEQAYYNGLIDSLGGMHCAKKAACDLVTKQDMPKWKSAVCEVVDHQCIPTENFNLKSLFS